MPNKEQELLTDKEIEEIVAGVKDGTLTFNGLICPDVELGIAQAQIAKSRRFRLDRTELEKALRGLVYFQTAKLNYGYANTISHVLDEEAIAPILALIFGEKYRVKEQETLDELMGIDPDKDVFRSPKGYSV